MSFIRTSELDPGAIAGETVDLLNEQRVVAISNSEPRYSMNWRKVLPFAIAAPLPFVLAFICESLSLRRFIPPTPGLMAWSLFYPNGSFDMDFSFIVVSLLIDTACWLAVLGGAYVLDRRLRQGKGSQT